MIKLIFWGSLRPKSILPSASDCDQKTNYWPRLLLNKEGWRWGERSEKTLCWFSETQKILLFLLFVHFKHCKKTRLCWVLRLLNRNTKLQPFLLFINMKTIISLLTLLGICLSFVTCLTSWKRGQDQHEVDNVIRYNWDELLLARERPHQKNADKVKADPFQVCWKTFRKQRTLKNLIKLRL